MIYSIYELLWLFFIYAFMGWCVEVIYAAANHGKFVNRGFLFGPLCPVYGFGMLSVLLALNPVKDSFALLYLGSVVITSVIEFFVGYLSEKLLHERLWDYSDTPLNIKGYICLKFSLLWGVGALVIVDIINPAIVKSIGVVPQKLGITLLCVMGGIFLLDAALTIAEALKIPKRIQAVNDLEKVITSLSNGIGGTLADTTIKAHERGDEIQGKFTDYKAQISEKSDEFQQRVERYMNIFETEEIKHKLMKYREILDSGSRSKSHIVKAFPRLDKEKYTERFDRLRKAYENYMYGKKK